MTHSDPFDWSHAIIIHYHGEGSGWRVVMANSLDVAIKHAAMAREQSREVGERWEIKLYRVAFEELAD